MNVLEIIKKEHQEVSALIDDALACESGDEELTDLARDIEQRLTTHAELEERLFYPKLRDRAEDDDERVAVFEAYTEHAVAKGLIEMLSSDSTNDERFKAEVSVLGEGVKQHIREEEKTIFKLARDCMSDEELSELGQEWEKAKRGGATVAARR